MPEEYLPYTTLSLAVAVLAFLVFGLSIWNLRSPDPRRSLLNRWARWFLLSFIGAFLFHQFSEGTRPFLIWWLVTFLGWFLVESILAWLAVRSLSLSQFPLFPRYRATHGDAALPADAASLRLRDEIREAGFERQEIFRAEVAEGVDIMLFVYLHRDREIQLNTLLLPTPSGNPLICFILQSKTEDGRKIWTDNLFIPFGGFYPSHWSLRRFPLIRRFPVLLERHRKRLKYLKPPLSKLEDISLQNLDKEQREVEEVNERAGFLLPRVWREEYGLLSSEGKYRLWKEIWLLNYFARPVDYKPRLADEKK